MSLYTLLGALEIGLIFSLVALGVYISFRLLRFPDLTVDGSFPLGGAVAATLIAAGTDPFVATFAAMIAGAGLRIAAVSGTLLMIFMYLAEWPFFVQGNTNPFLDSHWIEALLLIIAAVTLAGDTWGVGKWWGGLDLVKKNRWLR